MKIFIKEGKLYLAELDNLSEVKIRSDNEITSLDETGFDELDLDYWSMVAFDDIPEEYNGFKIK